MSRKFWAVWREKGGAPLKWYDTKDGAISAAKQLVVEERVSYYVVESVGIITATISAEEYKEIN